MDSETHLSQQLMQLFASSLNLVVASPELDLIAAGLLDSLTFIDLLVQLEHEFGVQIDLHNLEVDNFRSITSIAAFIAAEKMVTPACDGV
jgi:acyl carrier protein